MVDFEYTPLDNENQKRIGTGNDDLEDKNIKIPKRNNSIKIIIFIGIIIAGIFSYIYYQNTVLHPKQTKNELIDIRNALFHYKESFDRYPNHLTELAKGRPLREIWLTDAWENPYRYEVDESKQSFVVTSAGSDSKFGTNDDLQVKQ